MFGNTTTWERFQFFWLEQLFMVTREWRVERESGEGVRE